MVQRHELEVDDLDERPHHPVGLEGVLVGAVELVLGVGTLHDRHAAEEHEQVGRGKDQLITGNTGHDLSVLVPEDDLVLEELEPGRSGGTEDGYVGKAWISGEN